MNCNGKRGEITATLGGREWRMCLTLGALAELEETLEEPDLVALAERFERGRMSARELVAIIGAGMRGAGHDIGNGEVAALTAENGVRDYVDIAVRLLAAAFPQDGGEGCASRTCG